MNHLNNYKTMNATVRWLRICIHSFSSIILLFLVVRFLLLTLGANSSHPIVRTIYSATNIFVAPFVGVFPQYSFRDGTHFFDPATLIAIITVIILSYLLLQLVSMLDGEKPHEL